MSSLTTAEALVLEALIARKLLGQQSSTFKNTLWIKPQLDALQHLGLLVWEFNEDADFHVVPTEALNASPHAVEIISRLLPKAPDATYSSQMGAS